MKMTHHNSVFLLHHTYVIPQRNPATARDFASRIPLNACDRKAYLAYEPTSMILRYQVYRYRYTY